MHHPEGVRAVPYWAELRAAGEWQLKPEQMQEARWHITGLRQCSMFADDVGHSIGQQMRQSADFIEGLLPLPPAVEGEGR